MHNMKTWQSKLLFGQFSSPRGMAPVSVQVAGRAYCVWELHQNMLCMHIMDISGIVHIVLVLCIYVYKADIVYIY